MVEPVGALICFPSTVRVIVVVVAVMVPISFYDNRITCDCFKTAGFIACPALDAFFFIKIVGLTFWSGNGSGRTDLDTALAPSTLILDDHVLNKVAAHCSRAFFIFYMGKVLIPKILNG